MIEKIIQCDLTDCAGYKNGKCCILMEKIKGKKCPFYKTREQCAEENKDRLQRLYELGYIIISTEVNHGENTGRSSGCPGMLQK